MVASKENEKHERKDEVSGRESRVLHNTHVDEDDDETSTVAVGQDREGEHEGQEGVKGRGGVGD